MTTPTPGPELFPVLTPPPGGLAQLRQRLDGGPRRRRRRRRLLAPWRVAVGAAAVALVVVIVARVGSVGTGVEVFGVAEGVGSARVEVGGQALSMQPLSSSTLLVWLPPS